ncbi:MAG: hypothetical protein Q7S52_02185 [bacterium]|nr:hypothetical protein [bacterium]
MDELIFLFYSYVSAYIAFFLSLDIYEFIFPISPFVAFFLALYSARELVIDRQYLKLRVWRVLLAFVVFAAQYLLLLVTLNQPHTTGLAGWGFGLMLLYTTPPALGLSLVAFLFWSRTKVLTPTEEQGVPSFSRHRFIITTINILIILMVWAFLLNSASQLRSQVDFVKENGFIVNHIELILVEMSTIQDAEELADVVDGRVISKGRLYERDSYSYIIEVPAQTLSELQKLIGKLKGIHDARVKKVDYHYSKLDDVSSSNIDLTLAKTATREDADEFADVVDGRVVGRKSDNLYIIEVPTHTSSKIDYMQKLKDLHDPRIVKVCLSSYVSCTPVYRVESQR